MVVLVVVLVVVIWKKIFEHLLQELMTDGAYIFFKKHTFGGGG